MNITTPIQVVTVITDKSEIAYQHVWVNQNGAAEADYKMQSDYHSQFKGWKCFIKKF